LKKLKVYLDTSIINFLFADDAPNFKSITEEFFQKFVALQVYDIFISAVVIDEIDRTENEIKKSELLDVIKNMNYHLNYIIPKQTVWQLSI